MGDPMSDSDVVVYSTGWCPYCERAKALLGRKGVAFRDVKVDEDPAERDAMLARSGGRRTVPQIFIGDHHVGGYDDLYALDKAGELDKLLGRA
jgi:glutaredoxin 3